MVEWPHGGVCAWCLCCRLICLFGSPQPSDDENSDNSNECVVCLSDLRDTLILPCRHLCLCNSCADTLRYQANNCPICRLRKYTTFTFTFRALGRSFYPKQLAKSTFVEGDRNILQWYVKIRIEQVSSMKVVPVV